MLPACPTLTARPAGNMLVRRPRAKADSSALQSQYDLIPIDHGFALPEAFEPPYFEWQHWPQVRACTVGWLWPGQLKGKFLLCYISLLKTVTESGQVPIPLPRAWAGQKHIGARIPQIVTQPHRPPIPAPPTRHTSTPSPPHHTSLGRSSCEAVPV